MTNDFVVESKNKVLEKNNKVLKKNEQILKLIRNIEDKKNTQSILWNAWMHLCYNGNVKYKQTACQILIDLRNEPNYETELTFFKKSWILCEW